MSNDGAWLMISTWIILNVSWAPIFCASHTGHGSFRDNSECISCITQPKYMIISDFWVVWHPRNIWTYLDNMHFSSMQWWWSSWWNGSPFTDQLVANGWSHFCPLHSVHTKFLQHRFWALLAVQLSGHWRPLPSLFGVKKIQSFLHHLRFLN